MAEAARDAGDSVVCLARGESGDAAEGVRLVRGDRRDPAVYDLLPGEFDAAVDVSRQPGQVRSAAVALEPRCSHFIFVSTGNVYADPSALRKTVDAPLLEPLDGDVMATMADYGPAKVACEQAVTDVFGPSRLLIARSGLIGGPGDWSGRTTYWPGRFAAPSNPQGRVLVPAVPDLMTQVIDVRDLALWLVDSARQHRTGTVNATGDAISFEAHIALTREITGHRGPLVWAEPGWLDGHGVKTWSGPRSLPLWLRQPGYSGFNDLDNTAARALGLVSRPLAETLLDGLRALPAQPVAGLTDDEERSLLDAWDAQKATRG
ncbi:epimerase [Frankia sp. QA3]|uniref:epimerase n=1 Tax=Frankia sp. QA3 TaxID=710111 RepID=UPI0018DEE655|nr:epimerase [Frankia sp. QA3]